MSFDSLGTEHWRRTEPERLAGGTACDWFASDPLQKSTNI
jgi:hypothetical protein